MKHVLRLAGTAALLLLAAFASTAAFAQGAINPGETLTTGSISPAGDSDTWTFSATTGDTIIVRVGEISTLSGNFQPRIRILDPSAVQVGTAFGATVAEVVVTAAATGTFSAVVDDSANAATGTYRISLAKTGSVITVSPGDEGGPLTNGATHTGTIDVGDLDVWTVSANAGDAIVVRMGETVSGSGLTPFLRLYAPGGALLSQNFSAAVAEVVAAASVNGTYIVVAGDGTSGLAGSGGYRLTLAKTGTAVTTSPGDEGGPLTNGATHTGTIDVGDLDVWTTTANAGDAIVVRMGETVSGSALTPFLRIYGPTGALLDQSFSAAVAEIAITAPAAGTYLVLASDGTSGLAGSGAYRLTLAQTGVAVTVSQNDEGGPMTNGAMHTGTIDVGDLDLWTVTAAAGDAIVVRVGETLGGSALTPFVRIYSPAGSLLDQSFSTAAAEVAINAPLAGTYLVVVGDGTSGLGGSGQYRLTLAKTGTAVTVSPGDEGGPLVNGTNQTGNIDVGDLDVYTVTATAGGAIVIRMSESLPGSGLTPFLRIYGPTGSLLDSAFSAAVAEVAINAPLTGTYIVVASDGTSGIGGSGAYELILAQSGTGVTVPGGDQGGALVNGAMQTGTIAVGDLDLWTVDAVAGDAIVVRMGETIPGTLTPWLRLYSPTGSLVDSSFSTAAAEVAINAPLTGTYLVVAGDGTSGLGGSGTYRITLAKTGTAVTVSAGDEGGPMTNGLMHTGTIDVGDLDVWTVSATAGQAIVVRAGETTAGSGLTPWVRVYSPTGSLVGSSFSAAAAEAAFNAPVSGTYVVVVADGTSGLAGTGGYRLTLAQSGVPVSVSAGDEGGPVANTGHTGVIDVGDLDVWTINAVAGDNLSITMVETVAGSALTPWLRLYSPTGSLVGSNFTATQAQLNVTAATTGTYILVAADATSGLGGSGGYTLNGSGATGGSGPPTLDIDASVTATKYDALTDGLIVLRYLFGLTGNSMVNNALGATATRTEPGAVLAYLDSIRTALDVDDNGTSDALTDGLIIIRYLFGVRGAPLINAAIGPNAKRTTSTDIENYIATLTP